MPAVLRRSAAIGVLTLAASGVVLPAHAGTAPPYNDLSAKGSIALCDTNGQPVTHGSIYDKPFVWMAQSSVPATAPYNGQGRVAFLSAYQPRKDAYPDKWNGDTLTASSRYTDASHPLTVGTPVDYSLAQFLHEFPTLWTGYVQLRMFLGAANQGINGGGPYPTTDIQVTGSTWTVVRGSSSRCTGKAVSSEVYLAHLKGASATPSATRAASGASPSTSGAGAAGPGASGQDPPSANAAGGSALLDTSSGSGSGPPDWVAAAVAFLLLALGGLYVWWRRTALPR